MTQCLVVDEDQAERAVLADVFRRFGFDMSEASNADAGLLQCRAKSPDVVVVTDRIGADSRDFVRRVRHSGKGKPPVVIIFSSNPDTDAIGRMIMDGASECIVKPFNQELVSLKLRQVGLI